MRQRVCSAVRRKAVWGSRRGALPLAFLLLLSFASSALAAGGSSQAPKAKPGAPSSRVKDYKLDDELTQRANRRGLLDTVSVIVTLQPGADLPAGFKRYVEPDGKLDIINGYALANVPVSALATLAAQTSVHRVNYSRPAKKQDALSSVAVDANASDPAHGIHQQLYGYTGKGITVAVVDSGLTNDVLDDLADPRVRAFVDFVTPNNHLRTDGNGHGTHVTGIVGGTGKLAAEYAGITPGTAIVALRVLNNDGQGSIANIIKALNWIYKNAQAHNIRVVNLSVGAAPTESYFTDPLTVAAKVLVDRGITVVAAAGNLGQNAQGQLQWGGITSPGIAPWVLTVCAFSTQGTYNPADDKVAAFSSSGPPAINFAAKPDLWAPAAG